jgi:hypothetical protein
MGRAITARKIDRSIGAALAMYIAATSFEIVLTKGVREGREAGLEMEMEVDWN